MHQPFAEVAYQWDRQSQRFQPAQRRAKFLKGPVPWPWLVAAAKLPGKALAVGLALWRLSGATKSATVRLSNAEVAVLGVDRSAKSRALKWLEEAGLVRIEQKPGRIPSVTILSIE